MRQLLRRRQNNLGFAFVLIMLAALLLGMLLGGCASVQGAFTWADEYTATSRPDTAYTIGVGDLVAVRVWDSEKLSTRARVRPDGRLALPLLGEMIVADRTPSDVAADIERQLKEQQLVVVPRVTIAVEEMRPLTVAVLGAVARAGMVPVERGAGVAEALASAGGLTEFAHKDRIYVVRRTPAPVRIRFTFESLTGQTGRAPLFRLQPGDVVIAE